MNETATVALMTTEELLALPDDGIDRELIHGQLREKPMTRRNRRHSRTMANLTHLLVRWLEQRTKPRGEILAGEAGVRIRRDPDTMVGIDVAYISAELVGQTPGNAVYIDGPPVLAIEILSPSDKHEEIVEKLQAYLSAGVDLVWIVDPDLRTVCVHRRGAEPELFNVHQQLSGEPELPGFRITVAEIFGG